MSRAQHDTYFSDEEEDHDCPLCMEEMDLSDRNFRPCECGYQICRFCWHHIKENLNGRCPACRRLYSEQQVDFKPISAEELARLKAEKKQKEREKRELESANRKHLANMRVVQKNLVYVVGLGPKVANEELLQTLRSNDYFGQYGKIHKIVINKRQPPVASGAPGAAPPQPSVGVYITYYRKEDAARAIDAVDGSMCDGRVLRASYGTTKYCSYYLRNMACQNPGCMYLHEPGEEADSFTKEDLATFKHGLKDSEHSRHSHARSNPNPFPFKKPLPVDTTLKPLPTSYQNTVTTPNSVSSQTQNEQDSEIGSALPRTASWAAKPSSRPGTPASPKSIVKEKEVAKLKLDKPTLLSKSSMTSTSSTGTTKEEEQRSKLAVSNLCVSIPPRPNSAASPILEFEKTLSSLIKGSFDFSLALPEDKDDKHVGTYGFFATDPPSKTSSATPTLYQGTFDPFANDKDVDNSTNSFNSNYPHRRPWSPSNRMSSGRPGSRFGFARDPPSLPLGQSNQEYQDGLRALLPGVNVSFGVNSSNSNDSWGKIESGSIINGGIVAQSPIPPGILPSNVSMEASNFSTSDMLQPSWDTGMTMQSRFANRSSFNTMQPQQQTATSPSLKETGRLSSFALGMDSQFANARPATQNNFQSAQEFFGQFLKAAAAQQTRPQQHIQQVPLMGTDQQGYEDMLFQDPAIMSMRMPPRPVEVDDRSLGQINRIGNVMYPGDEDPQRQKSPSAQAMAAQAQQTDDQKLSRKSSATSLEAVTGVNGKKKSKKAGKKKQGNMAIISMAIEGNTAAEESNNGDDEKESTQVDVKDLKGEIDYADKTSNISTEKKSTISPSPNPNKPLKVILHTAMQELYENHAIGNTLESFSFFRPVAKSRQNNISLPIPLLSNDDFNITWSSDVPIPTASVNELEKALGPARKEMEGLESRLNKLIKRNRKQVFSSSQMM